MPAADQRLRGRVLALEQRLAQLERLTVPIEPNQIDLPALAAALADMGRNYAIETVVCNAGQNSIALQHNPMGEPLVFRNGVALDRVPKDPTLQQYTLKDAQIGPGPKVLKGDVIKVAYWWAP